MICDCEPGRGHGTVCGGLAVCARLLLPGLVQDDQVYRLNDGGCLVNTTAQYGWALASQVVVYDLSVLVVGLSYPLIWWKVRQRTKVRPSRRMHAIGSADMAMRNRYNDRAQIDSKGIPYSLRGTELIK